MKETRGAKIQVKCKCCGNEFTARVADRKRGWAKYCSKSCKAKKQAEYDRECDNHNWVTQGDDMEACGYHNN